MAFEHSRNLMTTSPSGTFTAYKSERGHMTAWVFHNLLLFQTRISVWSSSSYPSVTLHLLPCSSSHSALLSWQLVVIAVVMVGVYCWMSNTPLSWSSLIFKASLQAFHAQPCMFSLNQFSLLFLFFLFFSLAYSFGPRGDSRMSLLEFDLSFFFFSFFYCHFFL